MRRALALVPLSALLLAGCVSPGALQPAATQGLPDVVATLAAVLHGVGAPTWEPTLGVDKEGNVYYSVTPGAGPLIGRTPGVFRSGDGGATWTDVSPRLPTGHAVPPETNDPYVYVDPATGRVFQFAMAPILVCSVLSWSDDGGRSWTTNPRGCGHAPPYDHQTLVAAKPRALPTAGYANVLHQCVNQVAFAECARSLDGGLTWLPGTPVTVGSCGGLHGHLVARADGVTFLPRNECGDAVAYLTKDDGTTWQRVLVAKGPIQAFSDPAMAVDDADNVYYAYVDEPGRIMLSVSADAGATWSEPVAMSPPGVTGHIPALAAGGPGQVVVAYPGTKDLPDGYASGDDALEDARWHAYVTITRDALAAAPAFETAQATPDADPLVRGPCGPDRCPGMIDFIDVVVAPDGTPYAAFVDACSAACAAAASPKNDASDAVMVAVAAKLR